MVVLMYSIFTGGNKTKLSSILMLDKMKPLAQPTSLKEKYAEADN